MDHATKECELVNFHGQAFDAYAYVSNIGISISGFPMKISYLTFLQCMGWES
jgi:hypothetical protein